MIIGFEFGVASLDFSALPSAQVMPHDANLLMAELGGGAPDMASQIDRLAAGVAGGGDPLGLV